MWIWVALPFPVEDPYKGKPRWSFPGHRHGECGFGGMKMKEAEEWKERGKEEATEGEREKEDKGAAAS